jgi:PAS domain S-box-containing protein
MNPVAELLPGWTMPEAIGRPLADVFVIANETTRAPVDSPVVRVLREGITVGLANHTVLFARDGREIPIDDSAAPIRDAGRTIMGVVLVFRDVTERRRLEEEHAHATRLAGERAEAARSAEALRDSEERYRSLVAASSDIVWTAGPDSTFDEPQPGWEAYTGQRWPQDAALGWTAAVHPDDRATVVALWEAARLTRSVVEVDGRVWHAASGEYRHCHGRGVPLLAADGSIRQWVGMIVDVHARRQAEVERDALLRVTEEARRTAEAASMAKDDFLSIVSHELRSPLQTMLTWVELLKAGRHDEHLVTALTESVRAQETVIDDLLDVSRIVAGKLSIERAPFDLSAVAAACLDQIAPAIEAKGLTVERRGLDVSRPVLGDPDRFTQALLAVLHNALKFTPSGGRIELEARPTASGHEIVVRDTGDGIAPELLPRVFERFWQAGGGKTRRHGGLGLGLAIAHHLITAQGGTISAASDGPGRGAVFTLGLAAADGLPAPRATAPARPPVSLAGLRILLVEDDEAMSDALTALLEHRGATVTAAGSVRTALALLDGTRPDVLLSDVGMPGESGYTLIREIRRREAGSERRLPALAMTGFASADDRDEAHAAGFDDHVPKPVDPDTLIARTRALTGGAPRA